MGAQMRRDELKSTIYFVEILDTDGGVVSSMLTQSLSGPENNRSLPYFLAQGYKARIRKARTEDFKGNWK